VGVRVNVDRNQLIKIPHRRRRSPRFQMWRAPQKSPHAATFPIR
jgi:hypothetical protein